MRRSQLIGCLVVLAWAVPAGGQSLLADQATASRWPAHDEAQAPRVAVQRPRPPLTLRRVFLGASGGSQSTSLDFSDSRTEPRFQETARWSAGYAVKSGLTYDAGVGVRLWRNLAAGVAVSRFEDERIASVTGELPHPFFFNRPRQVSGESDRLDHTEQGVHVSAIWLIPAARRIQAAVFAGPTFFSVRRGLVEDITYSEAFPYDEATFQGTVNRRISTNETGFHLGGDVSWFFTDTVGVGALVRFARATARLDSPANDTALSVELGGLQAGAGLRLRFGPRR